MSVRSALVVALATVMAGTPVPGQSVDALLRQRGEAFVAAMNAQGEALAAFARTNLADGTRPGLAERFAESMRATYAELGPVERHSIQVRSEGRAIFVFCKHAKTGTWQNYQFLVRAPDEHRLQLVFRAVAIEPLERPSAPLASGEAQAWLGRFKAQLDKEQPFSGIAVVRRAGADVYTLIEGVADASKKTPMSRSARLNMASGSKMFTAVAILQLVQAGRLSLQDALITHLPGFPDAAFARRATIHQLLTHTAGAGNYWDDAYEKQWGSITELRQMVPFVVPHIDRDPSREPTYSNSGFLLLGLVVEAVSGGSYYDYVQRRIFEPAGMVSTGFPVRGDTTPDVAIPYEPEMDAGLVKPGVYLPARLGARGTSAGGASSTVDDLLRFADALGRGTLLDARHVALMTQAHAVYGGPGSAYGYGTLIDESRGARSYGHGGQAPGTYFELRAYPERDTVMVVMSNYNTIAGPEIASALDHIIRNR